MLDIQQMEVKKDLISEQPQNNVPEKPETLLLEPDWEKIGKIGVVLLGLLYAVGMSTVNTYLYSIGVSEFSFLKAQYIYTGAIAMAPIILCFLSPLYGYYILKSSFFKKLSEKVSPPPAKYNTIFYRLIFNFARMLWSKPILWLNFLICLLLPLYVIFLFVDPTNGFSDRIWISIKMYWVSACNFLLAFCIYFAMSGKPSTREKAYINIPMPVIAFAVSIFFVCYTGWYLSLFSTHIYTNIPGQFGGGKPTVNRFLFLSDKVDVALGLGIEIQESTKLSGPISMLYETDKVYVILVDGKRVVRLNKELVAAVQVIK